MVSIPKSTGFFLCHIHNSFCDFVTLFFFVVQYVLTTFSCRLSSLLSFNKCILTKYSFKRFCIYYFLLYPSSMIFIWIIYIWGICISWVIFKYTNFDPYLRRKKYCQMSFSWDKTLLIDSSNVNSALVLTSVLKL